MPRVAGYIEVQEPENLPSPHDAWDATDYPRSGAYLIDGTIYLVNRDANTVTSFMNPPSGFMVDAPPEYERAAAPPPNSMPLENVHKLVEQITAIVAASSHSEYPPRR